MKYSVMHGYGTYRLGGVQKKYGVRIFNVDEINLFRPKFDFSL
jgi:hypothetical protein